MNKTYCAAAFKHIYSNSAGIYKLCCHAHDRLNAVKNFNTRDHSPFEFFNSDQMEDIRQKMIDGQPISGCEKCYDIEKEGFRSPRQYRFNAKQDVLPMDVEDVELKLRIFGNHCNLSCYMCIPYNSSTRTKELKEIGIYDDYTKKSFDAAIKLDQWDKIHKDVIDNIDKVGRIRITGGEPFLLPRHYKFLNDIPDEYAENIIVMYDTNFTNIEYKGKSIFDHLERFKRVTFAISCDHFGDKLSWIRYPIDVAQFERNLDTIINHPKSIHYNKRVKDGTFKINELKCTTSILNVADLYEIKEYYHNKFGLKINFDNIVNTPFHLNIKNHPDKERLIELYKNDPEMNSVMKNLRQESDKAQWNQGIHYLEILDQHRGTDYTKLWPDYKKIDNIPMVQKWK
jgi:organic radical activating enzyme